MMTQRLKRNEEAGVAAILQAQPKNMDDVIVLVQLIAATRSISDSFSVLSSLKAEVKQEIKYK
jgi:hypothetical protein